MREIIEDDKDNSFTHIVLASGSGGTHAGSIAGKTYYKSNIEIVGISVKDKKHDQEEKVFKLAKEGCNYIQCDEPKREDILVFDDYVGGGYGVPTNGMNEAVKLMATKEAILLDPVYSGKGFAGLIDLIQNKYFRLFATTNTVGLGDTSGLYPGTQQINQGQMDRWNIVTTLNYLKFDKELEIILAKVNNFNNKEGKETVSNMIKVADLTRKGFVSGDISTVMSPRTVLFWAEYSEIFKDVGYAFRVTFLNKCDDLEKNIIAEYYQRCFGDDLPESSINIKI